MLELWEISGFKEKKDEAASQASRAEMVEEVLKVLQDRLEKLA